MKITTFKKIVPEDFASDTRDLVRKLASLLNPYLDDISRSFAGGITTGDNLKSKLVSVELAVGVSTGTFSWTANEKPVVCMIGQLTADKALVAQDFSFSWLLTYTPEKGFQINWKIFGLDSAKKHEVTILTLV